MGELSYGISLRRSIVIDDRALAHIQAVVAAKLRRRESFFFSWVDSANQGGGRGSVWIDAAIPLRFTYVRPERHPINRVWLELLMVSANGDAGLRLIPEPGLPLPESAALESVEQFRASTGNLVRS